MQSIRAFILGHKIAVTGIAGVLLGAGIGLAIFSNSNGNAQTLLIHKENFKQEVSVSGKVIAAQSVELGFAQGGRIARVYVKVGDTIAEGGLIAEVENGDLRASIAQKQAALDLQKAKLAALQGGRKEETAVTQTNEALRNAIADSYTKAEDAVYSKLDQFISSPHSTNPQIIITSTDSSLKNQVEFSRAAIEQVLTDWRQAVTSLSSESDFSIAAGLAQTNLQKVSLLLADASLLLTRAVTNPSVSQSTLNGYVEDIAGARTSINAAASALTTALTNQKNAAITLTATPEDISAQLAQVRSAEADLDSARAQLRKTQVVAPFGGIITKMDAKAGAVVSSNASQIAMQSRGAYQLESFVPEINIALLKLSNPALVTLDAYGESVLFGAKVVAIDPAETIRDGVSTYRALLQFDTTDARIRTGMTANITITTLEKEGIVSIPQGIVIERDGKKYVQVQEGDVVVEQEVTTGAISSLGNIEILTGLNESDLVVVATST